MQKSRLKVASDEQASDILIKREVEWLGEDTHAPELANQELELDMDLLRSIINEQDPDPQIDENTKTELMPDKELEDNLNDSEKKCKQHVLPLAVDPLVIGRTSEKKYETSDLPANSDAPVKLRRGPKPRPKREQVWQCEFCLRVIKKKSDLKRHLLTHAKFKAYFVCEICGSSFTEKGSRKKHMRRKHADKAGPQATGDNSANTNQILKNPQTDSQTTFECEICSRSCKTKSILRMHLQTHSKDRKRKFACDLCDQKFYSTNALWCHKKVHTPYSCTCRVCGLSFRMQKTLKRHMLRYEHFEETQQIASQTSNNVDVPIKSELMSDEEFIDEGNERDPASNAEGSQTRPSRTARIKVAVT